MFFPFLEQLDIGIFHYPIWLFEEVDLYKFQKAIDYTTKTKLCCLAFTGRERTKCNEMKIKYKHVFQYKDGHVSLITSLFQIYKFLVFQYLLRIPLQLNEKY